VKSTVPRPSPVERKTRNSRRSASASAAGDGRASASSRKRASVACTFWIGGGEAGEDGGGPLDGLVEPGELEVVGEGREGLRRELLEGAVRGLRRLGLRRRRDGAARGGEEREGEGQGEREAAHGGR
jgi:hypothetical protein